MLMNQEEEKDIMGLDLVILTFLCVLQVMVGRESNGPKKDHAPVEKIKGNLKSPGECPKDVLTWTPCGIGEEFEIPVYVIFLRTIACHVVLSVLNKARRYSRGMEPLRPGPEQE